VPIGAGGFAGDPLEINVGRQLDRPDGMRALGQNQLLLVESGGGGRLTRLTLLSDRAEAVTIKEGYPDGAVAVTAVGTTAYVLEGQLAGIFGRPDPNAGARPFHATAVEVPP